MKSGPRRLRRNSGSMSGFGLEIIPDLWHVRSKLSDTQDVPEAGSERQGSI